jgi:GNAT superfamily N-acetyltransferase
VSGGEAEAGAAAGSAPDARAAVVPDADAAPGLDVEVATWRPVEVVEVDGWRVGFSGDFTRRGNSVVAANRPPDVAAAIARVEALAADRGVPPRFRVCSRSQPHDLDEVLADRGYRLAATTHVLVTSLAATDVLVGPPTATTTQSPPVDASDTPGADWLSGWLDVKASGGVDRDLARAIVAGSPATYLTARDGVGVVGVIRAGYAGEWVGLSCLMVAPRARRRGLARTLTVAAMRAAAERGAVRAFLQVEAANQPAAPLYAGMGFTLAETYHYRER